MTFLISHYRKLFCVAGFIVLGLIIGLSLSPLPQLPRYIGGDKLHHFIGYAGVTFCFMQWVTSLKSRIVWALIFILVGVAIEFIQPFVNRYFEIDDMLANTAGVIIGFTTGIIFHLVARRILKKTSS